MPGQPVQTVAKGPLRVSFGPFVWVHSIRTPVTFGPIEEELFLGDQTEPHGYGDCFGAALYAQ
jgi:hypothetical protein